MEDEIQANSACPGRWLRFSKKALSFGEITIFVLGNKHRKFLTGEKYFVYTTRQFILFFIHWRRLISLFEKLFVIQLAEKVVLNEGQKQSGFQICMYVIFHA